MKGFTLTILLLPFFVCCSNPDSVDFFVPRGNAPGDVYEFSFEMNDTLSSYDFCFYTLVDCEWTESIRLDAVWSDPSGRRLAETVYLVPGDNGRRTENYRSAVVPSVPGLWSLRVRAADVCDGFRGLGLICKHNGTRQTP